MSKAEPDIIINGQVLSPGQAMTLRVALSGFLSNMRDEGLGDDDTGKSIAAGYLARGAEVEALMLAHVNDASAKA